MNRKKFFITLLLGVIAVSAGRIVFLNDTPPVPSSPASDRSGGGRTGADEAAASPAGGEGVRLDLLNRERQPFQGTRRDLFAPLHQPHPKVVSRPAMPALPPPPPLPPYPAVPPPPLPPSAPPAELALQQELARFTYLGYLEKRGTKTIFLSAGDEIFVVKQGDRFGRDRKFQVAQLTPDRLVLRQAGDSRPITIPLVEQSPLSPAGGRGGGGRPGMPRPSGPRPPQSEAIPEEEAEPEPPLEEEPPPIEEEHGPFVAPGRMGSPGVIQPFGQSIPPNSVPPPGVNRPSPFGNAMQEEVPR